MPEPETTAEAAETTETTEQTEQQAEATQQAETKPPRTVPVAELARERAARKKAEDELKKLTDAQLSEVEQLRNEVAAGQKALADAATAQQTSRVEVAVARAAAKLGFSDADDALRLIDRNAIEFDDATGQPTNVDELLGALMKSKPYLASAAKTPQGGIDLGNGGAPSYTKDQLAKMSPDQINANWDKIQQAAKAGKLA